MEKNNCRTVTKCHYSGEYTCTGIYSCKEDYVNIRENIKHVRGIFTKERRDDYTLLEIGSGNYEFEINR